VQTQDIFSSYTKFVLKREVAQLNNTDKIQPKIKHVRNSQLGFCPTSGQVMCKISRMFERPSSMTSSTVTLKPLLLAVEEKDASNI
jgi:hypothetical protein